MNTEEITNYIFVESKLKKADLALIFGTRSYQKSVDTAYNLYKKRLVSKILVSGGINRITGKNEALVISEKLIALGVDKNDIILEKKSTNTLENVLFSKDIISKTIGFENIKTIIAVVKNYHSRRALMTLKKNFPENINFIPATYDLYNFNKSNWFESKKGKEKVMGECKKIKKYLAKGDIEEL